MLPSYYYVVAVNLHLYWTPGVLKICFEYKKKIITVKKKMF